MKYSDIEKMKLAGLVSSAQAEEIARHFRLTKSAGTRNYLRIAFCALGGLLVLAGIVMLISANWNFTPPLVKQISAVALLLGFWVAGLKFAFGKKPRPILGSVFCSLGAGMLLANIALYGQIYHISEKPSHAFGAWFLGIFLIPWIVRLRGVFSVSLIAAFCFIMAFMWDSQFLGAGGRDAVFILFSATVFSLGIFLQSLNEKRRERFSGYGEIAAWTMFPLALFFVQYFCYHILPLKSELSLSLAAAAGLPVFLAQLKAGFAFARERRIGAVLFAAAFGILFSFPALLFVLRERGVDEAFLNGAMMLALFAVGVFSMFFGAVSTRKFYVNAGAVMIFVAAIAAVFRVVGSLSASGIALILAGIFLLGFGFVLERQRKIINAKISAECVGKN